MRFDYSSPAGPGVLRAELHRNRHGHLRRDADQQVDQVSEVGEPPSAHWLRNRTFRNNTADRCLCHTLPPRLDVVRTAEGGHNSGCLGGVIVSERSQPTESAAFGSRYFHLAKTKAAAHPFLADPVGDPGPDARSTAHPRLNDRAMVDDQRNSGASTRRSSWTHALTAEDDRTYPATQSDPRTPARRS